MDSKKFLLQEKDIPTAWYNIVADMENKPLPPLNPKTKEPLKPEDLYPLFAKGLVDQEMNQTDAWIEIPEEVRDMYKIWRPTPLVRAYGLEKALDTPAHIYFKNESVSPVGSHKLNSAIPQAYFCKKEGVTNVTTETGAGQWGASMAMAAKHFGLEIRPLVEGCDVSEESFDAKEGIVCNSPRKDVTPYCDLSLNGLTIKEAIAATKEYVKAHNLGRVKVNYRLRDAIFSRQRYWGEPFPVYYKNGMPYMIDSSKLPLELPEVAKFLPTETGEPPLGHATKWAWDVEKGEVVENNLIDNVTIFPLELNTMPGFAGSSAYYLRYMDPHNAQALVSEKADHYWQNVDLYVGGTEHATGHLIYSRFWNKFLHDLGVSIKEEPFQKLVNQGMIQGRSNFVYRIKDTNTFVSLNLKDQYETTPLHVDVNIVSNDILDVEAFKAWRPEYNDAEFILEDGKYICGWAVEKMSKSMYNVVNPDMIVEKYGADTLRMYEMFLGPVEQSKPWDTNGIDGVHRFLKKLWNLFYSRTDEFLPVEGEPTKEELKAIHKLIKKVTGDIETFSYNTSISAFMICVNELTSLKCRNKEVLSNLIILLAPFAPHYAEELWEALGNTTSVCDAQWPAFNEDYLKEDTVKYTISFNGKARFTMDFAADADNNTIQTTVMADEQAQKWIEGKTPKKVIIVPKKIVNIVL